MDYEQIKHWIALKSVTGIGNIVFTALVDHFSTPVAVFSATPAQLLAIKGISSKNAADINGFKSWDKINEDFNLLKNTGIDIVTYHDETYPAKLLEIYDRPPFLYVKGTLRKEDINISIVGSRIASTYGRYTTERISRELAFRGITVVSGLARGIDSTAHRGALTAKGRTIAVLGSGLDIIYPPENKNLFTDITENGAVVSEYPPQTPPRACNFPARNRIISGMSYGVVVVEAGEKSGSLITARLALEQNREVFAVPGSIDATGSRGTNKLIKQGAKLIENIDDILEEILPQCPKSKLPAMSATTGLKQSPVPDHSCLNHVEKQLVGILSDKNRLHIDEMINLTGLSANDVASSLMMLELNGMITQFPGKFFSLHK